MINIILNKIVSIIISEPAAILGPIAGAELFEGVTVETKLDQVLHVITQALDEQVHDVVGSLQEEDHQHEEGADEETRLTDPPDTSPQPCRERRFRNGNYQNNQQ